MFLQIQTEENVSGNHGQYAAQLGQNAGFMGIWRGS